MMQLSGADASFPETPNRVDIALALAQRDGLLLVARRAEDTHLGGLWEFPGGKIEAGEDPGQAARRELLEETGLIAGRIEPLTVLVHDYADLPLRFHVYLVHDPRGDVRIDGNRPWAWKSLEELISLHMPAANHTILRALGRRL